MPVVLVGMVSEVYVGHFVRRPPCADHCHARDVFVHGEQGDRRPWGLNAVGRESIPTVGLFLCSLDYALRFSRSGWKQESVLPIFESPVGLSCFLTLGF